MREITMAEAIREALAEEITRDPSVYVLGEDVGAFGGCFGVTKGLYEKFPNNVLDTMIAETGIMGLALGGAYAGLRMVPELMFSDFTTVAFDYFVNQAGKNRYMTGMQPGGDSCCLVVRLPNGAGTRAAAQHSQCMEGFLMHSTGIKIAVPSTPRDAKGMLKYALRGNDPVAFFEHKSLYGIKGEVPDVETDELIPFGSADVKFEGDDVTVIATQFMVNKAINVAKKLKEEGIGVEVIDPRSLKPLDLPTILKSVKKTGRVVLVNEAPAFGNSLDEVGMQIAENLGMDMVANIVRVCGPNTPIPFSPVLEDMWIVNEGDIETGIRKTLD